MKPGFVVFVLLVCSWSNGSALRAESGTAGTPTNHGHPQAAWQRYTVDLEEFSALLPVVPAMNTTSMYINKNVSRRERILSAYSDGVVYAIYTFEKKSITLDDLIHRFENGSEANGDSVSINGINGKSFKSENDDVLIITQFFATDNNLYVFKGEGSKLREPVLGISEFLSSIQFNSGPEGERVLDGPGAEPASNPPLSGADNLVVSGRMVTTKVKVVSKPEPVYTQKARMNGVTGTIVLRAVFSSTGAVTDIHALSDLPDGLTDKAIAAAKQIRFIPAIKDGHFVSMWIEIQYNFNLY